MSTHIPVFKNEIITNLAIKPEGVYVDLTLGGGGHSREIWQALTTGTLIAFDIDAAAITAMAASISDLQPVSAKSYSQEFTAGDKTLWLVNTSFSNLKHTLAELGIESVDGIIADLGWSADQLSSIPGLAYDTETPMELDMRMDQTLQVKAADLLNGLHKPELLALFEQYADIVGPEGRNLVDKIMEFRHKQVIATNLDLLTIIYSTLPSASHRGSRSFSRIPVKPGFAGNLPARVFQALRIAVNNELSRLQSALPQAWDALKAGGVLQVISFHSGEDRIVKQQFSKLVAGGKAEYVQGDMQQPGVEELRLNLRARSAKLRSVRKLTTK